MFKYTKQIGTENRWLAGTVKIISGNVKTMLFSAILAILDSFWEVQNQHIFAEIFIHFNFQVEQNCDENGNHGKTDQNIHKLYLKW